MNYVGKLVLNIWLVAASSFLFFNSSSKAEIKSALLLTSDREVQVTLFRDSKQKADEAYILIEGTATDWDDKLTLVKVKEKGSGLVDYNITWKNYPYTILTGRSGTYGLSLPKPFKEYYGLSKASKEEVTVDLSKLETLLTKSLFIAVK